MPFEGGAEEEERGKEGVSPGEELGRPGNMGVADDFAPSFTQKPQLRQEADGNRLIFECQLISSPKPEISWYRGEVELGPDTRTNFRMQSVGTNKFLVVLELDDVIETDAGLYKVKAKNKMGEVAASINLNFSRKWIVDFLFPSPFLYILFYFILFFLFLPTHFIAQRVRCFNACAAKDCSFYRSRS